MREKPGAKDIKRASPRRNVVWPIVSGHIQDGNFTGELVNVSAQGMRLLTRAKYQVGEVIEVCLPLEDESDILLLGRILWIQSARLQRYTYGLSIMHFCEKGFSRFCYAFHLGPQTASMPEEREHVVFPDHPLQRAYQSSSKQGEG